jgi:ribosomal subunit interface protein
MDATDFAFEFYSEVPRVSEDLKIETEHRLRKLAHGHSDMVGADVAVEPLAQREQSYLYRARVVVYIRPTNLAASEQGDTVEGALKGALSAVERQVREHRKKLRERWKQPQNSEIRAEDSLELGLAEQAQDVGAVGKRG